MAKKYSVDRSLIFTCIFVALIITSAIFVGLIKKSSPSKNLFAEQSSTKTSTSQSTLTDDSTPPLLQSDKGVLLIAAIDKKTLNVSGVSIDYLIGNAEPERLEGKPMLVLEGYDLFGNHIHDQPLPTDDQLTADGQTPNTSGRQLDYWVVSTQLSLPLRTVYWQIRYEPSKKIIWKTNVHHFLLNQSLEMMPVTHFVNDKSNKLIKDQIDKLETIYMETNEKVIIDELSHLKELILQETEENALKMEPLEVDQKDFLALIDNLLNSIETRNID